MIQATSVTVRSMHKDSFQLPQLDYRLPRWNPVPEFARNCPFCDKAGTALLLRPDGLPISQCGSCRCYYVSLQVSEQALAAFYAAYWAETCPRPLTDEMAKYLLASAKSRATEDYFFTRISALLRSFRSKKVLDVGCGFGEKATIMASMGAEVVGLDVSREAAAFTNSKLGIPCKCQTLQEYRDGDGGFDLITMFEFIEHPLKPVEVLQAAMAKLRPGGLLAITTPNGTAGSRWQPGAPDEWIGFRVDLEHMQYLHVATVDMLAHVLGMTVVHLEQCGYREPAELEPPRKENPVSTRMRTALKGVPGVRESVYGFHDLRRRFSRMTEPRFGGGDYHLFCVLQKNG